jgi:hypothetical protein
VNMQPYISSIGGLFSMFVFCIIGPLHICPCSCTVRAQHTRNVQNVLHSSRRYTLPSRKATLQHHTFQLPGPITRERRSMPSLLHHPSNIPMRPITDKEMEVVDLDQLFEQYFETDLLEPYSDSTADRSCSDDLAHLFDLPSSNESDVFATSPIPDRDIDSAWHQAVQRSEQNPASSMSIDSSSLSVDTQTRESHSDSELLNLEDLFESERNQLRSLSQPSTPRPHTARSVKKAVSFQGRLIARGVQKTSRKSPAASFAKMMQPPFYRSPISDVWTRKMESSADSFGLRAPSNGISSPPLSSKLFQHENGNTFFSQHHRPYTADRSPLASPDPNATEMNFSNYQFTPLTSPSIGISNANNDPFSDNMGLTFSSSATSSAALSALQTPPSSHSLPMTTWGPDASPAIDFSFSVSPDYAATKTAGWWNDDQPSHSRSRSQNMSFSNDAMAGLGISCESSSFGDFAGLGISGDGNGSAVSYDMPYMYPTPPHHRHNMVPIGHRPLSRSPSPCPQPRFHRHRPSSHHHQRTHSSSQPERRKSSNSSNQSSRQSSSGNVGFVNFTPNDSRKILTGVAPSGSSKTKARREKEAADKRRKLSQAAVKAVMDAGGDPGSLRRLEREGLLS